MKKVLVVKLVDKESGHYYYKDEAGGSGVEKWSAFEFFSFVNAKVQIVEKERLPPHIADIKGLKAVVIKEPAQGKPPTAKDMFEVRCANTAYMKDTDTHKKANFPWRPPTLLQ